MQTLALILLTSSLAGAIEPAPVVKTKPPSRVPSGYSIRLCAADAALVVADIATTERIQRLGGQERIDAWLAGRHPSLARTTAVQLGEMAAFQGLAWLAAKRGHKRIAKALQWGRVLAESYCVSNNAVVIQQIRRIP